MCARSFHGLLGAFVILLVGAGDANSQSILWEKIGPPGTPASPWTAFGASVDAGEDVSGDGIPDVLVGASGASVPLPDQGQVFVYSGIDGLLLHAVSGTSSSSFLGMAVLLVGDLNGDGRSEFAANGSTFSSVVNVYSGADASLLLGIPAPVAWPCSGWRPTAVLDLDGNGVPDLALGCPYGSPPGAAGAGIVAVVSGVDGSPLQVWPGAQPFDRFGWDVANAGDLDGDGTPDLLAGAPRFFSFSQAIESGLSFAPVLSGGSGAPLFTFYPETGCPTCINPRFGWSVSGGGDLDGDGVPDLIVGEMWTASAIYPGVAAFSGATGGRLYNTADLAGRVVGHLGDVDGDGFGDFFGTTSDSYFGISGGCVFVGGVIWGCGEVRIHSGQDGSEIFTLVRQGAGALGTAAALVGDVDGDEFPEIAVGDSKWWPGFGNQQPGRLTVFSLTPIGVTVFGGGCPGSSIQVPRIGFRGTPSLGETVRIHLSNASPGASAFLLLGFSSAAWGGFALPLDLANFGVPGCSLLVSPDFVLPQTTAPVPPAPGRASVALEVPSAAALAGASVFAQWLVTPAGLASASMTKALEIAIQP